MRYIKSPILGEFKVWAEREFEAIERALGDPLPVRFFAGTGDPENVVTAPVGSLFIRTDGGAGTTLYVKESGAGDTGWAGK